MDNNSPSPSISIKPKDSTIDSKFGVVVTTPNYLQFFSDVPSYYQFLKDPKNYKDLLLGTVNISNLIRNSLLNPEFKQLVRDIVLDIDIPSIDTDNIVTIGGEQEVKGRKDFTGGLAVNGQNLIYDPVKKVWQLTGDLVVTGAVTMFGSLSGFTPSTVTDAVLVDGTTIVKTKNSQGQWQLTAIGGGGGTGGGLTSDEVNILITNALYPVNKKLETKWTQDDTKITDWDSAFNWGDHSKAGYMKSTDFDTQLKQYILKDTVEQISARHNFTDGLQIAGINIYKSQDKTIYLDANLVVSGAFTMFGKNSTTFETIWKDIPFDLNTMEWTGSVWRVKDDGSGSLDTNAVNGLIYEYLNRTGEEYAKQSWVNQQGFAKQSALTAVDNRLAAVEVFFATEDSDTLINKWSEIVDFLNATEGDTLDNILATKANQSALDTAVASLTDEIGKKWTQNDAKITNWDSAYGWGNHANAGYAAKTYVDGELAKYVKLATAQIISARHNFSDGLQIGGIPIRKSQDGVVYIDGNLVISGAFTMFGNGSTTFPTIWSQIPFNTTQMKWENGVWNIIGGSTGSVDDSRVNVLISEYLAKNNYATQTWVGANYLSKSGGTITIDGIAGFTIYRNNGVYSAIHFYNTQDGNMTDVGYLGVASNGRPVYLDSGGSVFDLIHSNNYTDYFTKSNIKSTLGISDWALAGTKPSYTAAEVGALATSGGSVSSDGYQPLFVNSNFSSGIEDVRIAIAHNWNVKGLFNWESNGVGLRMYNTACGSAIGIKDDGTPYYDSYELIHSGNIGSYNAGSATKLQTTRTIWGQKFDGSGNVDGALYMGAATMLHTDDSETWLNYGGANDGKSLRLCGKEVIFQYGRGDAFTRALTITNGGNIAVGDTTADYKFHVHGIGAFNNGLWAGGIRIQNTNEINSYGSLGGTGNGALLLNYRSSGDISLGYGGGSVIVGGTSGSAKLHVYGDAKIDSSLFVGNKQSSLHAAWLSYSGICATGSGLSGWLAEFGNGTQGVLLGCRGDNLSVPSIGTVDAIDLSILPDGGNVVIGGTIANEKLHIKGNARVDGVLNINGAGVMWSDGYSQTAAGSENHKLYLTASELYVRKDSYNKQILMSIDTYGNTTINGNLLTTGAITMFSQLSMKDVIDYDGLSLAQLAQIKPARFTWKDRRDNHTHVGCIADHIQPIIPEVVYETANKELTVDYGSAAFYIGASLIKPVIDHEKRIAELERENKRKDEVIVILQNKLNQLSA